MGDGNRSLAWSPLPVGAGDGPGALAQVGSGVPAPCGGGRGDRERRLYEQAGPRSLWERARGQGPRLVWWWPPLPVGVG